MALRSRARSTRLLVVTLVAISLITITVDYRQGDEGPLAAASESKNPDKAKARKQLEAQNSPKGKAMAKVFVKPTPYGFFSTVLGDTYDGMFADPVYGGNRDYVGWNLVGIAASQGSTFVVGVIVANLLGRQAFGEYAMVRSTLLAWAALAPLAAAGRFTVERTATLPMLEQARASMIAAMNR